MVRERALAPGEALSARAKEILRLHGDAIARDFRVFELDLSVARDNERIPFKGNFVGLMYISAIGSPVRVRLDADNAESIPFYAPGGITIAFDEFYLTNAAMPGVTGVLMAGWDLR